MTLEDGLGQIIKVALTVATAIALTMNLTLMMAPFSNVRRTTPWTSHPSRLTQFSDGGEAFRLID